MKPFQYHQKSLSFLHQLLYDLNTIFKSYSLLSLDKIPLKKVHYGCTIEDFFFQAFFKTVFLEDLFILRVEPVITSTAEKLSQLLDPRVGEI